MSETRPASQIGASSNGMMLPTIEDTLYPIQIKDIHVRVGDYVAPDSPIYTLMDRDGGTQSYNYGSYGQITKIAANTGDISTAPQRIFELCCDEVAQAHARAQSSVTENKRKLPPKQKSVLNEEKRGKRWELAGALLGIIVLTGVILNANGVFNGRNTEPMGAISDSSKATGPRETPEETGTQSQSSSPPQQSASRQSGIQPIIIPGSTPGTIRGRQTLENGTYAGDLKDGARHGNGIYTFDNGDRYEGAFSNNARTGKGTYEFASGTTYSGNFVDEILQGEGQMNYSNGTSYSGGFKNGDRDGSGRIQYANGVVYEGSWTDNEYNGTGTLTFANGAIYSGDFVKGARTGKGNITFADGGRYEGDFVDGAFQGFGRYDFASGGNYLGAYRLGKQHGDGVLTLADGGVFKGAFVDGKPQGQGVFTRRMGDVITGTFRGDIGTGTGRIKFADGDSYSGDFSNGELKGKTKFQKRVKFRQPKQPKPYASYQEMMDTERDLAEQRYAERRYRRARRAARRAKRSGNQQTDNNTFIPESNLPNTMYYAVLMQSGSQVPDIGERIQCANTVQTDVTCSVARKQKVWVVARACDRRYSSDIGEALDRARLVVYMAKGNTDRMRNHFIRWNKAKFQAAGSGYTSLESKIWDELSAVKMKTPNGDRIPVYYNSYAKMSELLYSSSCRTIDLNAGKGAPRL